MSRNELISNIYKIARDIRATGSPQYAPIVAATFGADAGRARISTLRKIEAEALQILAQAQTEGGVA